MPTRVNGFKHNKVKNNRKAIVWSLKVLSLVVIFPTKIEGLY